MRVATCVILGLMAGYMDDHGSRFWLGIVIGFIVGLTIAEFWYGYQEQRRQFWGE